jgi:uncharacterized protein YpuA (DUF1002 family)
LESISENDKVPSKSKSKQISDFLMRNQERVEQIKRTLKNDEKENECNKINESTFQKKENNTNWEDIQDDEEETKKKKIANLVKHLLGVWRVRR